MNWKQKVLFVVLAIVGVVLTLHISNALAVDASRCDENPHPWITGPPEEGGFNGTCEGLLEAADMPAFLEAYAGNNLMVMSQWPPIEELQVETKPFALRWVTPRNHMMPFDEIRELYWGKEGKSHALMFSGELDVQTVPQIWKFSSPNGDIYHIDSRLPAECEQFCHDWGCEFDDGTNRVDEATGKVCGWSCYFDEGGQEVCPDMNGPVFRISSGGTPMTKDNITSITWHNGPNGPETVSNPALWDSPLENLNYMSWDTGLNILTTWQGMYQDNINAYSRVFSDHAQPGPNTWTIAANNGSSYTFTIDIPGPIRPLPVVPATITSTTLVAMKDDKNLKSGKAVKYIEAEVVTNNITAREITDEDGETRLLIQWAEPDLAMTYSEYQKDIRLRIYVGDMVKDTTHFLWMDIPITSGTCVVPAPEWQELKQILSAKGDTEVFISGQYREQYNNLGYDGDVGLGYHNRGYFGIIKFPIQ